MRMPFVSMNRCVRSVMRASSSAPAESRLNSHEPKQPANVTSQVAKEIDHGSVDFPRTFLLGPMAALGQYQRAPELRDQGRQIRDQLFHAPEGQHQVTVAGNIQCG